MLKETISFTLTGHGKEELTLSIETSVHLFGKTRVDIDYAGASTHRNFEWPGAAKDYIEELFAKWEGPPIEGVSEMLSELARLEKRSRERWQEAHEAPVCKTCAVKEVR